MNVEKTRQYFCGEEEENSFVPNICKKISIPYYIYFKRKGKLDRKYTLGLCIGEVGNRIYHIETDYDSFFVSKDFCYTGIPSSKQIANIAQDELSHFQLDNTFFLNGSWHDSTNIETKVEESSNNFENSNEDVSINFENSNEDVNINFENSNENVNINFENSNEEVSINFEKSVEKASINFEKLDEETCINFQVPDEEACHNFQIHDGEVCIHSEIPNEKNMEMFNLTNQSLSTDQDIFTFLNQNNDKIVYFVDGSATNLTIKDRNIKSPGVGILEVFDNTKEINYYSESSFLKGRASSPSFGENESLKQFIQNKKQPQNDLWCIISTMLNMARTGGYSYESRHFSSKQSTFNKIRYGGHHHMV
uniref:Uncharacterized protein n=1 Tax=Strongyloides stercoralis TaxID=6248 RepID=A0AAF5DHJ5_STRER